MIARLFSSSRWKATLSDFLSEHLIHRDEDFMVIHKPAGLLTVPGKTPDLQDCLINRLLKLEPKTLLIHRLDQIPQAYWFWLIQIWTEQYFRQFQDVKPQKFIKLWLLDISKVKGIVDIPVIYDPSRPPLHIVDASHHKPALTEWQAIEHFEIQGQTRRVKFIPITGAFHQLRVHMQYLGHPILGDTLYATPEQQQLYDRLCLHANRTKLHSS